MHRWAIMFCGGALIGCSAQAQTVRTIYTIQNAILCESPFKIKEAKTAAAAGDAKWLAGLDCVQTAGGLAAAVIESSISLGFFKVRIQAPNGDGFTVFGSLQDFVEPKEPQKPTRAKPGT